MVPGGEKGRGLIVNEAKLYSYYERRFERVCTRRRKLVRREEKERKKGTEKCQAQRSQAKKCKEGQT